MQTLLGQTCSVISLSLFLLLSMSHCVEKGRMLQDKPSQLTYIDPYILLGKMTLVSLLLEFSSAHVCMLTTTWSCRQHVS